MSNPTTALHLSGLDLDTQVCVALGIAPELFYDATRDGGESYMDTWTKREPAEDWVAHMKKRFPHNRDFDTLTVIERKIYPRVSSDIREAWALLDRIHSHDRWRGWVFSKRMRFYDALAGLCVADARPMFHGVTELQAAQLQSARVAWPAAMGVFRKEMPEFICRAILAVVEPEDRAIVGDLPQDFSEAKKP